MKCSFDCHQPVPPSPEHPIYITSSGPPSVTPLPIKQIMFRNSCSWAFLAGSCAQSDVRFELRDGHKSRVFWCPSRSFIYRALIQRSSKILYIKSEYLVYKECPFDLGPFKIFYIQELCILTSLHLIHEPSDVRLLLVLLSNSQA